MDIQRYDIDSMCSFKSKDGEWCKYEDVEKLEKENEELPEVRWYYLVRYDEFDIRVFQYDANTNTLLYFGAKVAQIPPEWMPLPEIEKGGQGE